MVRNFMKTVFFPEQKILWAETSCNFTCTPSILQLEKKTEQKTLPLISLVWVYLIRGNRFWIKFGIMWLSVFIFVYMSLQSIRFSSNFLEVSNILIGIFKSKKRRTSISSNPSNKAFSFLRCRTLFVTTLRPFLFGISKNSKR